MIAEVVHLGRAATVAHAPLIVGTWLVSVGVVAVWDATTIALFGTLILTVGGAVVTLWPQLAGAGVRAEKVRTDYAVQQATGFWQDECKRLREERQQAHQMFQSELRQRSEEYRALERDLRLQCQQAERQLQMASTRAARFETLWRSATGQSPQSMDDLPTSTGGITPPSAPAIDGKGASS